MLLTLHVVQSCLRCGQWHSGGTQARQQLRPSCCHAPQPLRLQVVEAFAGEEQVDIAFVPEAAAPSPSGMRRRGPPLRSKTSGCHTTQDMSPMELTAWLR